MSDTDECNSPISPCHKTCTDTDGNFTCSCQPGYIIDSIDTTRCRPKYLPANTTAIDNIGLITTPNYPHSYGYDYTCFWTIPSKPQMLTTISFIDFYLERVKSCTADSLKIFNGTLTSDPILQVYCGQLKPDPITSYSNLHLVFRTDDSNVYRGFKLIYTYEKDECSNPRSPCHKTCTNTNGMYTCNCQSGYLLDGSECKANYLPMNAAASDNTGLILTPNYPQWYPYNVSYFWSLPPRSQMITSIRFLDFDLNYDDNCEYDYLKVYNGTSANDPLIDVYCGVGTPSPISSTNGLFLVFGSYAGPTRLGFKIAYTYESMPTQE
ncbi:tolloid-like protein 2 [Physella acuta]|uniref:tolloid-like protein 2 n=1 Tax=Physella acuta TaxID=109671 RepID=UPI0027DD450D|nr:tolloid-like protein 2 [Physella acuta]